MFSQPMGRGHAQFEFSRHEMQEILADLDTLGAAWAKIPQTTTLPVPAELIEMKTRSGSVIEFRAMLRAMLAENHQPEISA